MEKTVEIRRAGDWSGAQDFSLTLAHDERHLRRRVLSVPDGPDILLDLPEPTVLAAGDALKLSDGRHVGIVAAVEPLFDVRGRNLMHLTELAWHIGNRHLAAAIDETRILILRDHVIKTMLEGLGATVTDVHEPFAPVRGAYAGHAHSHTHAHHHGKDDDTAAVS